MRKCASGNRAVCQDCPPTNQARGSLLHLGLLTNQRRGMSFSEARHADQLVVRGGASLPSDSDHLKRKATTTTQYHNPGSWAYLGMMTFVLLTFMSCQPVMGIEVDIFPESGIIEVGEDLNITCILRNDSVAERDMSTSSLTSTSTLTLTSNDIVWYKDQDIIPFEDYYMVNDMSMISIVNASLTDAATYHCALFQDSNVGEFQSSMIQVGYIPQPATSLTCSSHNVLDYECEWDPIPTHIINESHTFQFIFNRNWNDCPELRPPNKCFISFSHHSGSMQEVRVVSSNDLGDDAVQTASFNPDAETIPLPPGNLTLTSRSSTALQASWALSADWDERFSSMLAYRLQWALESNPKNWLGELLCSSKPCEIRQLEPYTKYLVEVAAQYKYHKTKAWGEWSDPAEGRTDEAVPVGTVQNLQTSYLNGMSDYERNVQISWETVAEGEQRGPILGYFVTVIPHLQCVDQQTLEDAVNNTQIIMEDPLPPSVVEAETLSHQSILVTWDKPAPVQGYISHYTVHWIQARGQDQGQSKEVPSSNLSYVVNGLEGYVLYSFKVSVTNKIGVSGWSTEVQITTDEWTPEASPTNVTVEPIMNNPNGLLVNWIDVSEEEAHGQVKGHHLYYCRVAEESISDPLCQLTISDCLDKRERQTFSETTQKPVTLTGVDPFSHYVIWISAFTSVGEGPTSRCPSSGLTSEGTPSQPLNASVLESTATSIALTWSPPLEKNGIIRNYTILVKSNSSTDQQEFYAGGVQSYLVEGLYGYVHYSLQVRACSIMCGAASDEVYRKTEIGVPQQPENLNVQPLSHNKVKVSWESPVHPNGPTVYYLVSYSHIEPTPRPVIYVRSSLTTTLANSMDDWIPTTELTMEMEVDCSQAPFLFQVVAVNIIDGSLTSGDAAEFVLSECIEIETTLSPLIWLILPGGAILLFALLVSLYYVQSKLGKSWPDPVYTDMVKNKKDMQPLSRPKRGEREEFDTIQNVCPPDLEEVVVAEEYPSQPYQCIMQTSMTDPLTDLLNLKSDIGKQAYLRTVSIDSGVPPSPQDHLDFSSSDDVFHAADYDTSDFMQDTYSFENPKVIVCQAGLGGKGGHLPKRSVSLSSSDGCGGLPAIEEDKFMDPILEKVPGDKNAIAVGASTSAQGEWLEDDDDEEEEDIAYMRISQLSSPLKKPQVLVKDQCAPVNQNKLDDLAEVHTAQRIEQTMSGCDSGCRSMASDSGYVSNNMAYMKFGLNEVDQETEFKAKPDDDYVSGPMTYSVLAIPQLGQQPRSLEQSLTSNYVTEESLAYTKLGMASTIAGNENVPITVAVVEQPTSKPCIETEGIGYVKLGDKHEDDGRTDGEVELSWSDMTLEPPSSCLSDYVRGVDLHKVLENKSELSESSGSPGSPICIPGDMVKVLPEITLDETKAKEKQQAVRSRTDSSSSSSGYGSDHRGQVSGYVVVSTQPQEHSDNYANLAFTSSESETDSDDVDVKSKKSVHLKDALKVGKCSESPGNNAGSGECDPSFVEYISNDSFGIGFVNDYPSPSKGNENLGFSDTTNPSVHSKEQSNCHQGRKRGSCKSVPGYITYNAVLGAEATGIATGVERLLSPATPDDASKRDIYQVPSRGCRELKHRTGRESDEGDDGYVPFGGDSGYVLRVLDGSQKTEEYMPMSPIKKSSCRIEEDCL
eukprot:XP_011681161.1 PREDICTED: uncharacterized protein LOC100890386 [Strongylocentrotus purpuratus]